MLGTEKWETRNRFVKKPVEEFRLGWGVHAWILYKNHTTNKLNRFIWLFDNSQNTCLWVAARGLDGTKDNWKTNQIPSTHSAGLQKIQIAFVLFPEHTSYVGSCINCADRLSETSQTARTGCWDISIQLSFSKRDRIGGEVGGHQEAGVKFLEGIKIFIKSINTFTSNSSRSDIPGAYSKQIFFRLSNHFPVCIWALTPKLKIPVTMSIVSKNYRLLIAFHNVCSLVDNTLVHQGYCSFQTEKFISLANQPCFGPSLTKKSHKLRQHNVMGSWRWGLGYWDKTRRISCNGVVFTLLRASSVSMPKSSLLCDLSVCLDMGHK